MKIHIKKWFILDRKGIMWEFDATNEDVTEEELGECISEQIYGDNK